MLNLDMLELKNKVLFLSLIKKEMIETNDSNEKQKLQEFYFNKSFEMNDYIEKILEKDKKNKNYKNDMEEE